MQILQDLIPDCLVGTACNLLASLLFVVVIDPYFFFKFNILVKHARSTAQYTHTHTHTHTQNTCFASNALTLWNTNATWVAFHACMNSNLNSALCIKAMYIYKTTKTKLLVTSLRVVHANSKTSNKSLRSYKLPINVSTKDILF